MATSRHDRALAMAAPLRSWWKRGAISLAVVLLLALIVAVPAIYSWFTYDTPLPNLYVAPPQAGQQQYQDAIDRATDAERRRIGELDFATNPFPFPLPANFQKIPAGSDFGEERPAVVNAFWRFASLYEISGCADGVLPRKADRSQAEWLDAASAALDGVRGPTIHSRMVFAYHRGLIAMCRGDTTEAQNQFQDVLNLFDELQSTEQNAVEARRYRRFGEAGLELSKPAADRVVATLKTLVADCGGPDQADYCNGFDLKTPQRAALAKVYLMLTSAPAPVDSTTFDALSLRASRDLDARMLANIATAAARSGNYRVVVDFWKIAKTCGDVPSPDNPDIAPCEEEPQRRIAQLAAIAGVPAPDQEVLRKYPIADYWLLLGQYRKALREGRFGDALAAQRNQPGEQRNHLKISPEDRKVLDGAYVELLDRLWPQLLQRAVTLRRTPEGAPDAETLFTITKGKPYSWQRRAWAATVQAWSDNWRWGVPVMLLLLLLFAASVMVLIGYDRMHTRRHYVQRTNAAGGGAAQ